MPTESRDIAALADLGLSRVQLWQLIDRLEALHGARTVGRLIVRGVELLEPFFDADTYSVGFTDPGRSRHVAVGRPGQTWMRKFARVAERYRALASQSPMLQYWSRTGDHQRVLRRSDCCDVARYRNTELFWEVDRPNDVIQHMGTWLRPGGGRHLEIAMSRSGRTNFSKRDVARLSVLRKHVFRAYVNVCDLRRIDALACASPVEVPADAVELQDTSLTAECDRAGPEMSDDAQLSPRERDVLHWIVEGKTNREIGIILNISWRTVRLHCERIFRKLNVETRTAAAMRAVAFGLTR
jgi:DNA-binding CsgD family transcriptional regulator